MTITDTLLKFEGNASSNHYSCRLLFKYGTSQVKCESFQNKSLHILALHV